MKFIDENISGATYEIEKPDFLKAVQDPSNNQD